MLKKRKLEKGKEVEYEHYEIDVEDWKVSYFFQINKTDILPSDYWESSTLILLGKIVSPALKNSSRVKIFLKEDPELDEHWKHEKTDNAARAIGWMDICRDDDTLEVNCYIPSRSFQYLPVAIASGKVKHAHVFGTKLKWRKGRIFGITLSTCSEDE